MQLAVSIEPMEVVRFATDLLVSASPAIISSVSLQAMNLGIDTLLAGGQEERRNFARAIAKDLWTFLASFSQHAPMGGGVQTSGEMMLVRVDDFPSLLALFSALQEINRALLGPRHGLRL